MIIGGGGWVVIDRGPVDEYAGWVQIFRTRLAYYTIHLMRFDRKIENRVRFIVFKSKIVEILFTRHRKSFFFVRTRVVSENETIGEAETSRSRSQIRTKTTKFCTRRRGVSDCR